ncbi:MAG: winged helix-turn-helix domain-containing protein [Xanthobacteraceae bacterium]
MTLIRFGNFRLDLDARQLADGGSPVQLGSRALDILCVLAKANGETVSKDQLMADVWAGRIVEENNIQVHISAIRKALGRQGQGGCHLLTIPGQGYRLIPAHDFAPDVTRGELNPALPDKPSIAVLPFRITSDDPAQQYLADGLTDDIIIELSRIRSLFVIARHSSFAYRNRVSGLDEVGRDLGVRYVLEGSVRCAGSMIRITAQLIEASSAIHVWADKYDGNIDDIFDAQDEITRGIVSTIQTQIVLNEGLVTGRGERPEIQIWNMAKRGWREVYLQTAESLEKARVAGHEIIRTAPDSAKGYQLAACAAAHLFLMGFARHPPQMQMEAQQMAEKAVTLDQGDEYAHWILGIVYGQHLGRYEAAFSEFRRALEINPNFSLAYGSYGTTLAFAGLADESLEKTQVAIRLNPRDPSMFFRYTGLSLAYFVKGDYETANEWARRAVTNKPGWWFGLALSTATYSLLSRHQEAEQGVRKLRELLPGISINGLPALAIKDEFLARLKQALKQASLPDHF